MRIKLCHYPLVIGLAFAAGVILSYIGGML